MGRSPLPLPESLPRLLLAEVGDEKGADSRPPPPSGAHTTLLPPPFQCAAWHALPQYTTALHREHGFRATLPPAVSAAPHWAQVCDEEAAGLAAAEARRLSSTCLRAFALTCPCSAALRSQRSASKQFLLHAFAVVVHAAEVELRFGVSLLGRAPPQSKHLVHLPLLSLGQGAPRRLPAIHAPLHVPVPPRRLLKQLFGAQRQLHAAHRSHLLDPERPQPLHA